MFGLVYLMVLIYEAFCFDVTQTQKNGAPNGTWSLLTIMSLVVP